MVDILRRVDELEAKYGNNEKLALTLCEAEANAVKMGDYLEKSFIKLLAKSDSFKKQVKAIVADSKPEIEVIIEKADRGYTQKALKQYRTWIATGLLFILAQIAIETVKWSFSLLHNTSIPPHP